MMVRRVSLSPLAPKDTLDKNRRRSANARLTTEPRDSKTLGTESYEERGSSLQIPFIIDSDDEKDDKATIHSGWVPKLSPKAVKTGNAVEFSTNLKPASFSMPSGTTNLGDSDQTVTNKHESSSRLGPEKLQALCGVSYVKLGNLRNHQDGCPKCKAIQDKENNPSNDQKELSDQIKQLSTSTRRKSGADKSLDRGVRCDTLIGNKFEMSNAQKEIVRTNNSNTTQLVSWSLSNIATQEISPSDEEGYVYILHDPETSHLKIGRTKDPKKRASQHEKCGRNLEMIHISKCVAWMKRAEKLILSDLKHLSKPRYCHPCAQSHGEYFEVTVERAKAIVDRWAEWINRCAPYQADRSMTSIWKYLVNSRMSSTTEIETHDHEARWAHWDWILSAPSESDGRAFERQINKSGTGCNEEKIAQRQHFSDGARYVTRETLNAPDGNDIIDQETAGILDGAAVALAEKLRGNKDCMTMEVTFRVESSSREALVYSVHWLSQ